MAVYQGYLVTKKIVINEPWLKLDVPAGTLYVEHETYLKIVPGTDRPQSRIHSEPEELFGPGNFGKPDASIIRVEVEDTLVHKVQKAIREQNEATRKLKASFDVILDSLPK